MITQYECKKCKAKDSDRGVPGLQPPVALNCWKCGAGKGMDIGSMLQAGAGMFPLLPGSA